MSNMQIQHLSVPVSSKQLPVIMLYAYILKRDRQLSIYTICIYLYKYIVIVNLLKLYKFIVYNTFYGGRLT